MAQRGGPERGPERRRELKRLGSQVHDVVGNDAFLDALVELAEDERAVGQLRANPRTHLRGKGLPIPDEMSVEFTEGPPWGISLSLTGEDGLRYGAEVRSGQRGPESELKDRGRFRRLHRQVRDDTDSDAFLDALEESASDTRALAEFKANPRAHLQRKGRRIADEVEVEVSEVERSTRSVCIRLCVRVGFFLICITVCITVTVE